MLARFGEHLREKCRGNPVTRPHLTPLMRNMGRKHKSKPRPVQRDSTANAVSILKICPYRPYCPLVLKTSPARQDSEISIFGVGSLGILRSLGILGWKTKKKTSPVQRDSGIYKLAIRLLCPYCLYCPLVLKTAPAQADSGMSNLKGNGNG